MTTPNEIPTPRTAIDDCISTMLWLRHEHREALSAERFLQISALSEQAKREIIAQAKRIEEQTDLLLRYHTAVATVIVANNNGDLIEIGRAIESLRVVANDARTLINRQS